MKLKNFILAGFAGGIVDFLLGWLFYGFVFSSYFPPEQMPNLLFIFLGCMSFGFLASYLFTELTNLTVFSSGLKRGAIVGLFVALINNFFVRAGSMEVNYEGFAIDVVIAIIISSIVGGVVAAVNGALSRP